MGDPEEIIAPGEDDVNSKTALLLRDLIEHGVSRFHPDPLAALT
jgi:hypothetical protein